MHFVQFLVGGVSPNLINVSNFAGFFYQSLPLSFLGLIR